MKADKTFEKWLRHFRVPGGSLDLREIATDSTPGMKERAEAERELAAMQMELSRLQDVLYAQGRHALLVVLQAMDTGGKDGTIRHVFGPLNPQGIRVTSFKAPSPEELAHDYLWRIHNEVPPRGMIGIFNRSHYEDVLIVRVHKLAPLNEVEDRYEQINAFERYLTDNRVHLLKIYLHISRDEQRQRLQARLDDPTKHWKFNPADVGERQLWNAYRSAYELALTRCDTKWAPWHIVPADRKWYRDWVVARIVLEKLLSLKLEYPAPPPGLDKVEIE